MKNKNYVPLVRLTMVKEKKLPYGGNRKKKVQAVR